ncbi:MAG: hypothetical protein M3Q71_20840 [Chloroflexota bacterium]|nr:hypothetical protein [Actinomycetota bacterium]MDP9473076.1 hypothetical protein [Chloroflexota bacterium]
MRRLFPALVLVVVLVGATAPAARGVERMHGVYRGQSVRASFTTTDGSCIATIVDVFALASTIQWLPGTPYNNANIWVSVTQVDTCTGQTLLFAPGYATTDGVSIDPSLNAARVQASLQVYNWNTDAWIPVEVDLAWAASGACAREGFHEAESGGGDVQYVIFEHSAGTTQPATAAGSVMYEGVNLAAGETTAAEIVSTREGELFVAPHNDPD